MEVYWNKLTLDKPPTTSWRCTTSEFRSKNFANAIDRVAGDLKLQTMLGTEAALLSRLIYRMKSKLRNDKGLKNMEKVNRALLNYLQLSLEKEYRYLASSIECDERVTVLPSRQMFQYVLVRTQGFGKLMVRIEDVAKQAGKYFRSRIILGQAWNMSLVAYAVISRIWLLSRHLTKKCCNWYSQMYQYHDKLKMVGVSWLPDNYAFPRDLKRWLNVEWINEDSEKVLANESLSDRIFNLISHRADTENDVEFVAEDSGCRNDSEFSLLDESIGTESPVEESGLPKVELSHKIDLLAVSPEEVGQRISRERYAATTEKIVSSPNTSAVKSNIVEIGTSEQSPTEGAKDTTKRKQTKESRSKNKVAIVDNIKTKDDVMKFLMLESYPGLDKLRWNIVRKNVNKLFIKLAKYEENSKKQDVMLNKIIQCIREWTN